MARSQEADNFEYGSPAPRALSGLVPQEGRVLNRKSIEEPRGRLQWKVRSFALGAGLAIGGMMLSNQWLVLAAIAVLASGFLLRFTSSRRSEEESESDKEPRS